MMDDLIIVDTGEKSIAKNRREVLQQLIAEKLKDEDVESIIAALSEEKVEG